MPLPINQRMMPVTQSIQNREQPQQQAQPQLRDLATSRPVQQTTEHRGGVSGGDGSGGSGSNSGSGPDRRQVKMFHEKMTILNENFTQFINQSVQAMPAGDFTPTLQDYLKHVESLDRLYGTPPQPGMTVATNPTGTIPTTETTNSTAGMTTLGPSSTIATTDLSSSRVTGPAQQQQSLLQPTFPSASTAPAAQLPSTFLSSSKQQPGVFPMFGQLQPQPTPVSSSPLFGVEQRDASKPNETALPTIAPSPAFISASPITTAPATKAGRKRTAQDDPWMEMQMAGRKGEDTEENKDKPAHDAQQQQAKFTMPAMSATAPFIFGSQKEPAPVAAPAEGTASGQQQQSGKPLKTAGLALTTTSPLAVFSTSNPDLKESKPPASASPISSDSGGSSNILGGPSFSSSPPIGRPLFPSSGFGKPASPLAGLFSASGDKATASSTTMTPTQPPPVASSGKSSFLDDALSFQPKFPADARKLTTTGTASVPEDPKIAPSLEASKAKSPAAPSLLFSKAAGMTTGGDSKLPTSAGESKPFSFLQRPTFSVAKPSIADSPDDKKPAASGDGTNGATAFAGGGAPSIFGAGAKAAPIFGLPMGNTHLVPVGGQVPLFGGAAAPKSSLFQFSQFAASGKGFQAETQSSTSSSAKDAAGDGEAEGEDEPEEPPSKPETVEQLEDGALCSIKCSVHCLVDGKYDKLGVGYISVKELESGVVSTRSRSKPANRQLIIRAATALGTIWTNTKVDDNLKLQQEPSSRLRIQYPASKPKDPAKKDSEQKLVTETMLIRVNNDVEREKLLNVLKSKQ